MVVWGMWCGGVKGKGRIGDVQMISMEGNWGRD
jgi:hypothetical protein